MTKKIPNTDLLKVFNTNDDAGRDESSSTLKYDSLTSKLKNDKSTIPYFEALDFAFSQDDVKNIAVTGPYGSGKSTVIESFLSLHKKILSVNVSLAGFNIAGIEEKHDPREVELSILQQILYKVDRDTVPDSRIDRIQDRNDKHVLKLFISLAKISIPILVLVALIFTDASGQFLFLPVSLEDSLKEHFILRAIAIGMLFLMALYYLTQSASRAGFFDKKLKLSKIAFLSGDTEVQEQESPSSLLNTCLDEIVYFFSRSKYRTVVFEDLDRLGTSDIFVKLREINKIVNNNRKNNEPVRFIYAVKDDIFLGADVRTKFFDFIVPIVPIMDSRNAYSILKSKILQFPEEHIQCLRGASQYIIDMRSLQNITNEYNLFMDIVDNQSSKPKLFALIFYKNLFALDYNLVDKKLGILYSYMRDFRTKKLHVGHFSNLDTQLALLENKLDSAKSELRATSTDVRDEILSRLIPKNLRPHYFFWKQNVQGYSYNWIMQDSDSLVSNEEAFIDLFSTDNICLGPNNKQTQVSLEPQEIRKIVEEYKERKELTREARANVIKQLQQDISEVRKNIRRRNEITLSELTLLNGQEVFNSLASDYIKAINDVNILSKEQERTVLDSLKYGGFDALYYLIINGYLMQDFMMYRSIFHKGSISAEDNEYIKKVGLHISHLEANDSCIIENVTDVTRELIENSYTHRDGALHHQVLAYLLHNNTAVFDDIINSLLSRKSEEVISVMEIIDQRFEDQKNFDYFIISATKIAEHQDKMLKVLQETEKTLLHTRIITSMMVYSDLSKSHRQSEFKQYIQFCGWSLVYELELQQVALFMNNAKLLKVMFDNVEVTSEVGQAAAEFIADNCMYVLSKENFCSLVVAKINQEDLLTEEVANSPWYLLLKYNLRIIKDYVDSNINSFVKEIFLFSTEGRESVLAMLNNEDVDINLKAEIITHMDFIVKGHFEVLNSAPLNADENSLTLHDLLYKHDRVAPNWSPLIKYVSTKCNPHVLHDYLARHAEVLSSENSQPPKEVSDDIYSKIVCDSSFTEDVYRLITSQLFIPYDLLDERISVNNLRRLVKNEKLPLDMDSYLHILYHFPVSSSNLEFILFWFGKYQSELAENMSFYMRREEDNEAFNQLLRESITSSELSDELSAKIICEFITLSNTSTLDEVNVPLSVLRMVLKSSKPDPFKLTLLSRYARNYQSTKIELLDLLNYLDEKEVRKVLTQKVQATFQTMMADQVIEFLSVLKARHFITQYTDNGNGRIVIKIGADF